MYVLCNYHSHRYHEHENKRGGRRALSEKNAYILRSLQLHTGLSDRKVNVGLGNAFMYFTGRVIPENLMWGKGTINAVKHRLEWFEKRKQESAIADMVAKYPRMRIFLSSDDSGGRHAISPQRGLTLPTMALGLSSEKYCLLVIMSKNVTNIMRKRTRKHCKSMDTHAKT